MENKGERPISQSHVSQGRWVRPQAELPDGRVVGRPRKTPLTRKSSIGLIKLRQMNQDEVAKVLAQGMGFSECCAALGVVGRALERYFKERPTMRIVWGKARAASMGLVSNE